MLAVEMDTPPSQPPFYGIPYSQSPVCISRGVGRSTLKEL